MQILQGLMQILRGRIHHLRVKMFGGNAVLLSLPYQINSMCKGNVTSNEKINWRANAVENTT